jgi:hypothetical protein
MRILIYTDYRTGSRSLGEWLELETGITYYHELLNPKHQEFFKGIKLEKMNECIVKISTDNKWNYDNGKNFFDKRIILTRDDSMAQAESVVWANIHNKWHNNVVNDKWNISYYEIDDKFLSDNEEKIRSIRESIVRKNEYFKSLKDCIHVTYEDLYFNKKGGEKIASYLGFTPKINIVNPENKLRGGRYRKRLI